jgi:YfiH family protein
MSASWLLRPQWPAPPSVRAACTLRSGGVSVAPYESLNLAAHVGDRVDAVARNRALLRAGLQLPGEPLWLGQVHGNVILDADTLNEGEAGAGPPQADGAVTCHAGRVLAVLVADCLPVLLARADGSGVAVAHAGWRGLASGVVEAAAAALGAPSTELIAWLGPAIAPDYFEVGEEVRTQFCERDERAAAAFVRNERQRWQCDLFRLARQRLERLNVHSIHGGDRCSFSEKRSFYSYRRDGVTGRIAALIWIEPASRA